MQTETFHHPNYMVTKQVRSRIDPDVIHTVPTGTICPHCKTVLPLMEHFDKKQCPNCKLYMQLHGHALECSFEVDFREVDEKRKNPRATGDNDDMKSLWGEDS